MLIRCLVPVDQGHRAQHMQRCNMKLFRTYLFVLQIIVIEDELSQVACPVTTKLVLDQDEETKKPLVQVHRNLVTILKPHQVDG